MKIGKNIRKWTEPLAYVVLVAAFGLLSTMVSHTRSEKPVNENDVVSFTFENDLEVMLNKVKESKEVSL